MSRKLSIAVLTVVIAALGAGLAQAAVAKKGHRKHASEHKTALWHGSQEPAPSEAPKGDPAPAPHPGDNPPHEEHKGFRGHVVHYEQGPGFGGFLRIKNDVNGEEITEFFGEKTDLQCASVLTGPYSPCDKSNLKDGTPVVHAEHAVNDYGHDVWMHVFLYLEKPSTEAAPRK